MMSKGVGFLFPNLIFHAGLILFFLMCHNRIQIPLHHILPVYGRNLVEAHCQSSAKEEKKKTKKKKKTRQQDCSENLLYR